MHWGLAIRREKGGFGTPYATAAEKFAPVSDLVLQCFVQNGDTSDPAPYVGFYDLFKEHSPGVRLWVYGQWAEQTRPAFWEDEVARPDAGLRSDRDQRAANVRR